MVDYVMIISGIAFFVVGIYILYNGDILSALLSTAVGYLLLSLGVDLYKSKDKCK